MAPEFDKYSLAPSPDYLPLRPGQRLIVIGDIHGDFDLLIDRLRAGSVLEDDTNRWKQGESAIVVQVGDLLDRGCRELECLELLGRLSHEAIKSGGAVIVLWGNHELMNVSGDFRCVLSNDPWKREFDEYFAEKWGPGWKQRHFTPSLVHNLPTFPARWAACQPRGIISQHFFAKCKVVVQVGHSVCVHAHWDGKCFDEYGSITEANKRISQWILTCPINDAMSGDERFMAIDESMDTVLPVSVPFWGCTEDRHQQEVKTTLSRFDNYVTRLVVGHERVHHARSLLNGCLWKVDSQGQSEVLVVTHLDTVKVLRRPSAIESDQRCANSNSENTETLWRRLTRMILVLTDIISSIFHSLMKL